VNNLIISFIVPAYRPKAFIDRFILNYLELDKVLDKAEIRAEIIFLHNGDDASIEAYFPKFKNIKVIYQFEQNNITPSNARNIGIMQSSGDYIYFHDVDDTIDIDFIIHFLDELKYKNDLDIIIFRYNKIKNNLIYLMDHGYNTDEGEISWNQINNYVDKYIDKPFIYTLFVHCWGRLFRRQFLRNNQIFFDDRLDQLEDVNFNFNCLMHMPKIWISKSLSYNYYVSSSVGGLSSLSGNRGAQDLRQIVRAYAAVKKFLIYSRNDYELASKKIRHLYATTIILWLIRISAKNVRFSEISALVDQYIRSKIAVGSMWYYRYSLKTSIGIPILLLIKQRYLLSILLKFKHGPVRRRKA